MFVRAALNLSLLVSVGILASACAGKDELPPWQGSGDDDRQSQSSSQSTYTGSEAGTGPGTGGASGTDAGPGNGAANDPNGNGPNGNAGNGDGGSGNGNGNGTGAPPRHDPATVCTKLSICCSFPKACTAETYACQGVSLLGDPAVCSTVLTLYEGIGCDNKLNLGAAIIPGFPGCPKPRGGFF